MTTRRQALIQSLVMVQNHPAHGHHDILTITACQPVMTEAELERHLEASFVRIAHWSNYGGNARRLANAQ